MQGVQILKVTDPAGLRSINKIIHDCKFDRSKINYNHSERKIYIEFEYAAFKNKTRQRALLLFKKITTPIIKYTLCISNISKCDNIECEYTGPACDDFLNEIEYEYAYKMLRLKTVLGNPIEICVNDLDVSITNTFELIGTKTSISLW